MKKECEIVQDLLPLYIDEVASKSSRELVEQHLEGCETCRRAKQDMEMLPAERMLLEERGQVLEHHRRKERSLAWKLGFGISAIFFLVMLIMMLVLMSGNVGIGEVVMTFLGLAIAMGVTVVPLMSVRHKLANAIIATSFAIVLTEVAYSVLYGGPILATVIATIFGLSIPFFPIVIYAYPIPGVLTGHKGAITMLWDSVFAYATIFFVNAAIYPKDKMLEATVPVMQGMTVALVCLWLIFYVIRYVRMKNALSKAGVVSILISLALAVMQNPMNNVLNGTSPLISMPNFAVWNEASANANISAIILFVGLAVGGGLIIGGILREKR